MSGDWKGYTEHPGNLPVLAKLIPLDEQKPVTYKVDVPDYLNDLNAMHEAEKVLSDQQTFFYCNTLERIVNAAIKDSKSAWQYSMATAAQRAEAFLRILNLWTE